MVIENVSGTIPNTTNTVPTSRLRFWNAHGIWWKTTTEIVQVYCFRINFSASMYLSKWTFTTCSSICLNKNTFHDIMKLNNINHVFCTSVPFQFCCVFHHFIVTCARWYRTRRFVNAITNEDIFCTAETQCVGSWKYTYINDCWD
jgi:hypothetical protein